MAYLTGFFLVFAGMLIGYFLWYRDRSADELAVQTLETETDDLRLANKLVEQSRIELEQRFDRQKGQLSVLQQLCEDWSLNREQTERERALLIVEVDDKRQKLAEAATETQRLKQLQIDLEDRLHQATRQHLEQVNRIEQDWQTKYVGVELNLNQQKNDLKFALRETERLIQSLRSVETLNAELKSEMASNKKLLETATKNVGGLKQEYVSLENSLKENHNQLKQARGETAAAVAEKNQAQQAHAELQQRHQQLKREIETLTKRIGTVEAKEQELTNLNQALASTQQQLELLTQQRDKALEAEKITLNQIAGLQTRLNNQESTIHRLRESQRKTLEKLKLELQLRSDLETTYEEHCKSLEQRFQSQQVQLQRQAQSSGERPSEHTDRMKLELAKQGAELKSIREQKDFLSKELAASKEAIAKTQAELAQQEKKTQLINHEAAKLKAETLRMARLESAKQELELHVQAETQATVLSFSKAMEVRNRPAYDSEYGGPIQQDPIRGIIYTAEPARRDDLKLIYGVAEVLEARLNDQGVYTFQQIANWSPEAVEEFGRLLHFRDRIVRDGWLEQARRLYQQTTALRVGSPAPGERPQASPSNSDQPKADQPKADQPKGVKRAA